MSDEDELKVIAEREDLLIKAIGTSDLALFEDVFSADVTYIHSTSIAETKEENIAGQAHRVHRHGFTTPVEKTTRIFGGKVAVTRGLIDMIDTAHGDPFYMRIRETLVWIKEDDGVWRLLVRGATRLPY
ncbi:MAG: nuclear transport factor 2 family protein [Propionibacteriaceae bacterium]|jgi:ketosteroid isomerase-like protein|nr:nuclear transport factor 2 family protein [Propionibacteriaceae bacterium]